MIAAFVWLWVALHLYVLEGMLVQAGWPRVDVSACACLFFGLFARTGWLPLLVLATALARAVLVPGDAAFHFLVLGIPTGMLVPLRRLFARRDLLWQALCAGALVIALPRLGSLLARAFALDLPPAPTTWTQALTSIVLVPAFTLLLRVLPPLSRFVERSE